MPPLKSTFNKAASERRPASPDLIWYLWAIAILEDEEQREEKARKKSDRARKLGLLRKGTIPRPF